MSQYMLLLHESAATSAGISPDEIQGIITRYKNWSASLAANGHIRGGNKLRDGSGRVLSASAGRVQVTDGPYSETKELVAGYFLIEAADYDQAAALAHDCPHLDFGTIEIREVEPTS